MVVSRLQSRGQEKKKRQYQNMNVKNRKKKHYNDHSLIFQKSSSPTIGLNMWDWRRVGVVLEKGPQRLRVTHRLPTFLQDRGVR